MTSAAPSTPNAALEQVDLAVRQASGATMTRRLNAGETVIVGAREECSIWLTGPLVSPTHCVLSLEKGEVWIHDWNSDHGTFVGEERITEPTQLQLGEELKVGEHSITVQPVAPSPLSGNVLTDAAPATTSHSAHDPSADPAAGPGSDSTSEPVTPTDPRTHEPADTHSHTQRRTNTESHSSQAAAVSSRPTPRPLGSAESETIELLEAELENLQCELAERDARIAELTAGGSSLGDAPLEDTPLEDDAQDELIARLDELLDELMRSDERVSDLEALLKAAEETCRAEREERAQLEAWVGDIERRVAQREAEFEADNQFLQTRLQEARDEQTRLEEQLRNAIHSSTGSESASQTVAELQHRCKHLQAQLDEVTVERTGLQNRLTERDAVQSEGWQQSKLEETLREERIKLAQQQAELARKQAELSTQQAQPEGSAGAGNRNEIDQRVKAFREHLREIHQQEKDARTERGLAARLGKLWKRLE